MGQCIFSDLSRKILVGFPCEKEPPGNARAPLQHEGGGSSEAVGPGDEAVPSLPAGDRAAHRVRALRVPGQGEERPGAAGGQSSAACLNFYCFFKVTKAPLGVTERP